MQFIQFCRGKALPDQGRGDFDRAVAYSRQRVGMRVSRHLSGMRVVFFSVGLAVEANLLCTRTFTDKYMLSSIVDKTMRSFNLLAHCGPVSGAGSVLALLFLHVCS